MLNYCPWCYAKCQTDQIDLSFKQSWWFFTKGPKSRHGIKRATGTISDFNPKLTSWYKTEAVEQPQGGWRIKNTEWPRNNQRTDWTQVKLMKTGHTITKKEKHRQRKEEKCPKKVTTKEQEANLNSLTLKLTSPQMVTIQDLGRSCF